MNTLKFLDNNGSVFPESDLQLFSVAEGKIVQEPFGDIDNSLSAASDMKTAGPLPFHSYENSRELLRYFNFLRNHKNNIRTFSYDFIRNEVKEWP